MKGLPDEGVIVIFAPEVAARAVEQCPEHADRIFTMPGIPENQAYVVDLDALSGWPFAMPR